MYTMKSIVQESSSVFKAIEKGWERAGKPKDFSVKIFEEPEKNFFGMTLKSAKVGIFFEEGKMLQKRPLQLQQRSQGIQPRPRNIQPKSQVVQPKPQVNPQGNKQQLRPLQQGEQGQRPYPKRRFFPKKKKEEL